VSGAAMKSHVDGTSWHTDGLRQGKKHSFSLLVGVALCDSMLLPDNGNLCVWPRSHLHVHQWMRHPDGKIARPASRGCGSSDSDGPLPDLGPPVQVLLGTGDVVIAHSEIAHCGGVHLGADIRSMLYYRVRHTDWKEMCNSAALVDDMWCDLEGVQHIDDAKRMAKGCLYPPSLYKCDHVSTMYDNCKGGVNEADHKCC
jgi:ectoine hydroxylase-related dioxygenase (phytanoyl-CoA dioxygenase family)